ncbi:MAG: hypothetical protein JO320_26290 [Alphaproteobacteria bacterium]|nr:hypothetical protein [Alphaproteobacteria bacterium]MBV9378515.1 hypothetical protein [Alphaproteobacteria bacterium]
MAERTILELAYERETLLQQATWPHPPNFPPGMPGVAAAHRVGQNRETYRKELIDELTAKILDLEPRNDREALIQLECIVDRWRPRLEATEQRRRTEALHQVVGQLIELLRDIRN